MNKNVALEDLTFEKALEELEQIVRSLESGSAPLEESITTYERGVALKKHCEQKLQAAQLKIDQISVNSNGQIQTVEFKEEK